MTTAMGYKATTDGDTLVVHGVPIFCACERGDFVVDEEWITKAVERAKRKAEDDGYLPPLHTRHHERSTEANDSVRAAGTFRITHSGKITLDGEDRLAVFADLIITDEHVQEEVMRMRYPYRSVEIFDKDGEPAIDSLALLDHEAPFLELPMLRVAEVQESVTDKETGLPVSFGAGDFMDARPDGSPVVACFRRGPSVSLLFRAGDEEPRQTNFADPVPPQQAAPQQAAPAAPTEEAPSDEEEPEKEKKDSGDIVTKVASALKALLEMMEAAAPAEEEEEPAQPEPQQIQLAPAAAPGAEAMSKTPEDLVTFARMQGEIEGLKAKDRERDAADVRKDDVAAAMTRLEGRPLGADLEEKLRAFHKDHGAKAFGPYVDAMALTGPLPDMEAPDGMDSQVPELAMKFSKAGTDAVDKAAQFCREWETLNANTNMRVSRESYVTRSMRDAGFDVAETA